MQAALLAAHRNSGEEPSQTAQAEMPLFQYCSSPLMGSLRAAAPVAMMTASASTTRLSVSSRKGGPCGEGVVGWFTGGACEALRALCSIGCREGIGMNSSWLVRQPG